MVVHEWMIEAKGNCESLSLSPGSWNVRIFEKATGRTESREGTSIKTSAAEMELTAIADGLRLIGPDGSVYLMLTSQTTVSILLGLEQPTNHLAMWRDIKSKLANRQFEPVVVDSFKRIDSEMRSFNWRTSKGLPALSRKEREASDSKLIVDELPLFQQEISLYTNGAIGKDDIGGWAFLLHNEKTGAMKFASGVIRPTSVNAMKMFAIHHGLNRCRRDVLVKVFTDMDYVANGMNHKIDFWRKRGWRREGKGSKELAHPNSWEEIWQAMQVRPVRAEWVKGRSGFEPQDWCEVEASRQVAIALGKQVQPVAEFPCLIPTG